MHEVQRLSLAELFSDAHEDGAPAIRVAMAGGSDDQPPGDDDRGPAEILQFPVERVRRVSGAVPPPPMPSGASPSDESGTLWPAWMTRVLARRSFHAPPADMI